MQYIKLYVILLSISLFIGCKNEKGNSREITKNNFELINHILKGETLGEKYIQKNFTQKAINYTCNINYVGNNNTSNEVNLIFKDPKIDSCYKSLNAFYNKHFKSNNNKGKFNTWSTDSLEVLLFKQTDSTILVNIFIKTYR